MTPPEGHDCVVPAHCLPVFREDGSGLSYVFVESDSGMQPARGSDVPPPDAGLMGAVTDGVDERAADSHERLKRLLKTGLKAAHRHIANTDPFTDPDSIIPIVIGCALCIDSTARSPFVEPRTQEQA